MLDMEICSELFLRGIHILMEGICVFVQVILSSLLASSNLQQSPTKVGRAAFRSECSMAISGEASTKGLVSFR